MENGQPADNATSSSSCARVLHPLETDATWLAHAKKLILDKEKSKGTIATLEAKLTTLQHAFDAHKTSCAATIQQLRQELDASKNAQSIMETRCNALQAEKTALVAKYERFDQLRTEFSRMSGETQQLLGVGGGAATGQPVRVEERDTVPQTVGNDTGPVQPGLGVGSAAGSMRPVRVDRVDEEGQTVQETVRKATKNTKITNTVGHTTPVSVVPLKRPRTAVWPSVLPARSPYARSTSLEGLMVTRRRSYQRKSSEERDRNLADRCGCFLSELQTIGKRCPLHVEGRYGCTMCRQSFPDRASWEEHERTHESKG